MRKLTFETNHYYHIYNRGVNKAPIFVDDADRNRFLESVYVFNDTEYLSGAGTFEERGSKLLSSIQFRNKSNQFVDITAYILMNNHFHLLLRQRADGGISKLMHKLQKGYSRYFNGKYDRVGPLFQGPFRAVHIESDEQLMHIQRYIHLNALDGYMPGWRHGRVNEWNTAKKRLEQYKWSSLPSLIGVQNVLPIVDIELVHGLNGKQVDYLEDLRSWCQRVLNGNPVTEISVTGLPKNLLSL